MQHIGFVIENARESEEGGRTEGSKRHRRDTNGETRTSLGQEITTTKNYRKEETAEGRRSTHIQNGPDPLPPNTSSRHGEKTEYSRSGEEGRIGRKQGKEIVIASCGTTSSPKARSYTLHLCMLLKTITRSIERSRHTSNTARVAVAHREVEALDPGLETS